MHRARKPTYTRPSTPCWVKITDLLTVDPKMGIQEGEVYPVAQVLWDPNKGATPVKIKSPTTGKLVGLMNHEFWYCDENGECLS